MRAEAALRAVRATSRSLAPELDDHVADAIRPASLVDGKDVSPVGVTRWAQPWVPLWCDWELRLRVDDRLERWDAGADRLGSAAGPRGLTRPRRPSARSAVAHCWCRPPPRRWPRRSASWLADEQARDAAGVSQVTELREDELAAAAAAAEGLDVLSGSLAGVRETLLGLDPLDARARRIDADGTPNSRADRAWTCRCCWPAGAAG